MLNLLQQRDAQRQADRLLEWRRARGQLKTSLHRHLPGQRVWLFGSLLELGRFNVASDIDLAIDALPTGMSLYTLTALLDEDMQRPVDVVYLPESRLRHKISTQGEAWIA
ncbi:MAG: nucleotidyltransferase family protein [Prosthecobacter sp.]|uniref:nucleotidyltransferase family protein n=1 Tax=Prosthecobacter sp. TaxID=1965333 RepID=UPI003901CF2A